MDQRISMLKETIINNLELSFTIEELSAAINLSVSRLRQIVKEETGLSFGEFVREQRLERARELLETTLMSVKEVGAAVGISEQSYFNRLFKEKYNLTPREYHKQNCVLFKLTGELNEKR